jgi:iron complex transport system permease protein
MDDESGKEKIGEPAAGSSIRKMFEASTSRKVSFIGILILVLGVFIFISLSCGSILIPIDEVAKCIVNQFLPGSFNLSEPYYSNVIINGREPRILLCILTGIILGASGTVMQSLLKNPLVSPFTLGVSSAASFGAAMAIVFGATIFGSAYYGMVELGPITFSAKTIITIVFAFAFGLLSMLMVLLISRNNNMAQSVLVLAGVVIGYLFQAGVSFAKYISDDSSLREIVSWLMGGMWGATWSSITLLLPIVLVCMILVERHAVEMNALSGGDDVAKTLGVDVRKMRRNLLIVCTMGTSACLAFTGVIGFIGLMAPHICRILIGNDNKYLIPASALLGAVILLISDTAARMILSPQEVPVGILLYLIGGIFFIWLISRKKGAYIS